MIHRVSCVGCAALILSPDAVGVYQNAQSALTSLFQYGRLGMCHVKCLETLRTTTAELPAFMKFNLTALCNSYVNSMLRKLINITETTYFCSFNMYLVISKCVTAVRVSNFSGHYLRNRSTLDISVLGYIGIV